MKTLQELRKEQKKKLKDVAKACNCSINAIYLYEHGKRVPPLNKIPLLANALNVSESEIINCFKAVENAKKI